MAQKTITIEVQITIPDGEVDLLACENITKTYNDEYNKPIPKKLIEKKLKPLYDAFGKENVEVPYGGNRDFILTQKEQRRLAKAQQEEEEVENSIFDRLEKLGDHLGIEVCSWSMSREHTQKLFDNAVLAEGPIIISYDGGWGKACDFKVDSPTYQTLWQIADKAVRLSGDTHHCFLECAAPSKDGKTFELNFGS